MYVTQSNDLLLYAIPEAIMMCIEDQNEELSSELVSLQDVPIPASIISSLANQGMYKVLYKIITLKRKMDTNENSYGTSKYFFLQQEDLDSHAVEKKNGI